ncbi:MAG: metal-binding protein [Clostridiales bacterium]|nr:metal-binding protein [Clostridiales bacterium]
MSHYYQYFKNNQCEYFPCHKGVDTERFNCLFCFCPLYGKEDCGGNYSITTTGKKDCTKCGLPHGDGGYDYIIRKIGE